MKKLIRPRTIIILLLIAGMAVLVIRRKQEAKRAPAYGTRPLPVRVEYPRRTVLRRTRNYRAVVEPALRAELASRLSARVETITVREGAPVKKGEVLVRLDDRDIRAEIAALEAQLEGLESNAAYWKKENERAQALREKDVIPPDQAEQVRNRLADARARLEAARSQLKTLRTKLSYAVLRAPFDGVVSARLVDPGDLAAPGKPLVTVETGEARIVFDVAQEDLPFVRPGTTVRTEFGGATREFAVSRVHPALDVRRMARAEADLPKGTPDVPAAGSWVPLFVVLESREALAVPESCLVPAPDGETVLFAVRGDQLEAVPVETGLRDGGLVEVRGDIDEQTPVVRNTFMGWTALSSGLKVEVEK